MSFYAFFAQGDYPCLSYLGHNNHHKKKTPPPALLASLPTQGIEVKDGLFAFAQNKGFELRFGDHVSVLGGNGAGKSLWWRALRGETSLVRASSSGKGSRTGHTDEEEARGGDKRFMFMSFSMHGQFLSKVMY